MLVAAAALTAALLAGCRDAEQDHPLILDKGSYTGAKDNTLSPAQLSELRDRVVMQAGADSTTGGGPGEASGAGAGTMQAVTPNAVRPAAAPLPLEELNNRLRMQSGN